MSVLTLTGNLTGDPELRFTASGTPVANFTVASTPRVKDETAPGGYKDGETIFMRCSIWRDAAENVAASLKRGTRVVVTGRMKARSYEVPNSDPVENRTVLELEVDEVGASCKFATLTVRKAERTAGHSFGGPTAVPA